MFCFGIVPAADVRPRDWLETVQRGPNDIKPQNTPDKGAGGASRGCIRRDVDRMLQFLTCLSMVVPGYGKLLHHSLVLYGTLEYHSLTQLAGFISENLLPGCLTHCCQLLHLVSHRSTP